MYSIDSLKEYWQELRVAGHSTRRWFDFFYQYVAGRADRGLIDEKVRNTRTRMLNLGFLERGYAEMADLVVDPDRDRAAAAARELTVWHLNQGTKEDAAKALEFLPIALRGNLTRQQTRTAAILSAEAQFRLGHVNAAQAICLGAAQTDEHADFYLSLASFDAEPTAKARWINKALKVHGLAEIFFSDDVTMPLYDRLRTRDSGSKLTGRHELPLVTVLMPTYNATKTIGTAIRSVQSQTWQNFELLVIDDCSTDNTRDLIEAAARHDPRVKMIQTPSNSGPYIARNIGLSQSAGLFVTTHDADDWSHPQKLETQALHLINNPKLFANHSVQARATNDMQFFRRGNHGQFTFSNMSSLMMRREPAMDKLGFWDSVRFGADHEFIRRATRIFGPDAIATVRTGPLSFQRQAADSLTGNSTFGFHGYYMGARQEYHDRQIDFHQRQKGGLRYEFPQKVRPFPVPEPMWPDRAPKVDGYRHFDVVIASEFRMTGGSTLSNAEEITAMANAGMRVGLVQLSRYDLPPNNRMKRVIAAQLKKNSVETIVYGEKIRCDLLIVRYPPILQDKQRFIPEIQAKNIRVIINQPPMSHYGQNAAVRYDLRRATENLQRYFGKDGIWHPIGPAIREILVTQHADDLPGIKLSPDDWVNILDVPAWAREARPASHQRPRIGRHARDHEMKWPDRDTLLKIYPASSKYDVSIMGGATVPKKMFGKLPPNWTVLPFNAVPVKDYLSELDVFLYYTHPQWVESFGRVMIEAMAVGVPVIVPRSYRRLFENAAIYAEPDDALGVVDRLMADRNFYDEQVRYARSYVERHFGHAMHVERVRNILNGAGRPI
jgi:glycosyltransferase involved in cell wall biosynthesis